MSLPTHTSCLVIGGGPAGLVSLKHLVEYGSTDKTDQCNSNGSGHDDPVLVEMESDIGGTFRWRGYENAELVSSKQLTCYSDFRYPLSAPDHPSLPNFVGYLHDYVSENKLDRYIHLSNRVISLSLSGNETPGGYRHRAVVRHVGRGSNEGNESTILARRVIITTGLHVTPNIPHIPGLNAKPLPTKSTHSASTSTSTTDTHTHTETLPPSWIHSSEYKSRSQLTGKNVLVLGTGETGMDVGYEAIMSGASKVWMGFRGGFLSFPKVLNNFRVLGTTFEGNLPIDGLITNLFETAYVHPWVSASHLRWFVSDFVIKRVLWVLTGTQAGCNQWAGELPPERQGRAYVFLNKSAKAMQFINRPYFKMSPFHRLFAHYIDPPVPSELNNGDPTIHLVPFPTSFDHNGAAIFPPPPPHRSKEIAWKDTCRPNLVILCTGYTQHWDWLGPGYPRGPDDCDIRGVSSSTDLTVGFIGFLRPGVGAIPPMAEMQAQFFLLLTKGQIAIPTSPETYHLLHTPTSRIQYGVDYSTYMAQLARDMGSAPSLWQLISEHGWFITFVYCFGAAFPTFFRLVGPYKSNKAPTIVKTELWETIKRRGVAGNIFMGVIPMTFYALVNLVALIAEVGWTWTAPLFGYHHEPSYTTGSLPYAAVGRKKQQ